MRQTCLFAALLPILLITIAASPDPKAPATSAQIVAGAEKEGKLVVYSTTDSASAAPLLKDFGAAYPKIALEYNDMNSTNTAALATDAGMLPGTVTSDSDVIGELHVRHPDFNPMHGLVDALR